MKAFELVYICAEPFLPVLEQVVHSRLLHLAKTYPSRPRFLDVGGRKSHYTIGIRADVTVTDLPRESSTQRHLNLGLTDEMVEQVRKRRSNIEAILYDDMTHSKLEDNSFDCVVAVEVLEHVEEDLNFITEVRRVLKPNGVFLMTTPNGDFIVNVGNPDHKRHYTREQLLQHLRSTFLEVEVQYAVVDGIYHTMGLKDWSLKQPLTSMMAMIANVVNSVQSMGKRIGGKAYGTHHLVATGRK